MTCESCWAWRLGGFKEKGRYVRRWGCIVTAAGQKCEDSEVAPQDAPRLVHSHVERCCDAEGDMDG